MLFPGPNFYCAGIVALWKFFYFFLSIIVENQNKCYHLSAGPLTLSHFTNPALVQTWRQKTVTGGDRKICENKDKFYSHLPEKGPKERSSFWLFTFFGGTSLAREGTFIARRGAAGSNSANLAFSPQIQG